MIIYLDGIVFIDSFIVVWMSLFYVENCNFIGVKLLLNVLVVVDFKIFYGNYFLFIVKFVFNNNFFFCVCVVGSYFRLEVFDMVFSENNVLWEGKVKMVDVVVFMVLVLCIMFMVFYNVFFIKNFVLNGGCL